MRLIGIATIIMVVVALLTPAVGAQEIENGNYVVTPGETTFKERLLLTSTNVGGIVMPMNAGSIKQGGSDLYSFNVPVGTTERTVDLNWGNPSNSLRLTIFTPIATLGPYYDSADGHREREDMLEHKALLRCVAPRNVVLRGLRRPRDRDPGLHVRLVVNSKTLNTSSGDHSV
jgi:hypothetical protein